MIIIKGSTQKCPYCEAQIRRPKHKGRGGRRCPVCNEWCSAYEIEGITKWYTYPLPWGVYFAAFEQEPIEENIDNE